MSMPQVLREKRFVPSFALVNDFSGTGYSRVLVERKYSQRFIQ